MLRPIYLFLLLLPLIIAQQRSKTCPIRLPQDNPETRSHRSHTPRIVGGDAISDGLIPYLVAIQSFSENFKAWLSFCTGTLISKRWILSAAHCGIKKGHRVLLLADNTADGIAETPEDGTVVVNITNVRSHPDYVEDDTTGSPFDIVAVELDRDIPTGAKSMSVNINVQIPETRSYVRVAGFGVQEQGDIGGTRRSLNQVDVPVTSFSACNAAYQSVSAIRIDEAKQVCAGYMRGECDSCQGDSGGPMIQYNAAGDPVLVGIVSTGLGCAQAGFPGIYIRTAAFEQWLDGDAAAQYSKTNSTSPIFAPLLSRTIIIAIGVTAGVILIGIIVLIVFLLRMWTSRNR